MSGILSLQPVFRLDCGHLWRYGNSYQEVREIELTTSPISLKLRGDIRRRPLMRARSLDLDGQMLRADAKSPNLGGISVITDASGAFLVARTLAGEWIEVAAPVIVIDGVKRKGLGFSSAPPLTDEAFFIYAPLADLGPAGPLAWLVGLQSGVQAGGRR